MNQARNYNLKVVLFMLIQKGLVGRVNTYGGDFLVR